MNILKDKGIFAFICSNKFAKADYGEKLRELILNNQLLIYNDFTGVKVFKEASVDTCVIQIKKDFVEDNEVYVDNKYYMEQKRLNSKSFIFNTPEVLNLRDKIFNQGTMIKDLDIQINYGIKTGFNDAFIIDEETKNRLIKEDSKNKEIIKPLLRGKDIKKWRIQYNNLYLIFTRRGININKYPSIEKYLEQYREDLTPKTKNSKKSDKGRKPGPYKWYEIQDSVAYYSLFEKEKIIYSEIVPEPRFVYDNHNYYIEATGFILNSSTLNLKYINALLNSKLLFWYFKDIGYNLGGKGYRYKKIFIEQLPLMFNKNFENYLNDLVDNVINLNLVYYNEVKRFYKTLYSFNIKKISNKLKEYYILNLNEFINEIEKEIDINNDLIKKEISKKFNNSCEKINELNSKIENIEYKINKIIYNIYGLSENEIKIIEEDI